MPLDTGQNERKFKVVGTRPVRPDGIDLAPAEKTIQWGHKIVDHRADLVARHGGAVPGVRRLVPGRGPGHGFERRRPADLSIGMRQRVTQGERAAE